MRQVHKPSGICLLIGKPVSRQARQKRCLSCSELFDPDPRTKGKQRYCSEPSCQNKRQRQNESAWRKRNPDCLSDQYKESRLWYKSHPGYSRQRRANNPVLAQGNRQQTKIRMQKARAQSAFDKSKVILKQLVGTKADKCYLTPRTNWLLVRLTKASLLLRSGSIWDNRRQWKQAAKNLPKGRLYDLSSLF